MSKLIGCACLSQKPNQQHAEHTKQPSVDLQQEPFQACKLELPEQSQSARLFKVTKGLNYFSSSQAVE